METTAALHMLIAKIAVVFCLVLAAQIFLMRLKKRRQNGRQNRKQRGAAQPPKDT